MSSLYIYGALQDASKFACKVSKRHAKRNYRKAGKVTLVDPVLFDATFKAECEQAHKDLKNLYQKEYGYHLVPDWKSDRKQVKE